MSVEPPRVYLDANVLLAYVSDEEERASVVQSVLDDGRQDRAVLLTSTLTIAEVAYAVLDGQPDLSDARLGRGASVPRRAERSIR